MALDGTKVIVPGVGHFYTAPSGTAKPADIDSPTVYTVVIANATAGTFDITVNGQTASGIAYNATTSALQTALEALGTVGTGKVTVSGAAGNYAITFDASVAASPVSVDGSELTGTTPTATLTTLWDEVGHTSSDSPLQVNRNGGDVTTLGSWQDPSLETDTADITWALAFALLQYDPQNLKLYYGSNSTVDVDGVVSVPKKPVPTECALFLVVVNGDKRQWRHYDRVQIIAADGENFDTTKLGEMPVQATVLGLSGSDTAFKVAPVTTAA